MEKAYETEGNLIPVLHLSLSVIHGENAGQLISWVQLVTATTACSHLTAARDLKMASSDNTHPPLPLSKKKQKAVIYPRQDDHEIYIRGPICPCSCLFLVLNQAKAHFYSQTHVQILWKKKNSPETIQAKQLGYDNISIQSCFQIDNPSLSSVNLTLSAFSFVGIKWDLASPLVVEHSYHLDKDCFVCMLQHYSILILTLKWSHTSKTHYVELK